MLLKGTLILLLFSAALGFSAPGRPEAKGKVKLSSMTGCVDEKPGRYVLVEDKNLKELVELQPVTFEKEGLAKYLGHKVTVRGEMSSEADHPVMKVHSVQKISDVCASAENQQ